MTWQLSPESRNPKTVYTYPALPVATGRTCRLAHRYNDVRNVAQLSPEFGRLGPSNASLFAYDFGQAIHPEDTTGQCPHCLSFPDLLVINVTYMLMHLASDQVKDPEKIQLRGVFGRHRFPSGHGSPPCGRRCFATMRLAHFVRMQPDHATF